jgi:serine/threonine protein kinase
MLTRGLRTWCWADVDMYSYGALLYYMAANRAPFDKLTDVQVVFCGELNPQTAQWP